MKNEITTLPVVRRTNRMTSQAGKDAGTILQGEDLTDVYFRAQRVANAVEGFTQLTGTPIQLIQGMAALQNTRYVRKIFFYGISNLATGAANGAFASWGWSPQTCFNGIAPWLSATPIYGSLIEHPDGDLIDLCNLYVTGNNGDGVAITAIP